MSKLEELRSELERVRKELNDKGYHYDASDVDSYEGLMKAKPFEIAYQDVIEKIWPDKCWWEVTQYFDIFDGMMTGLSDGEIIDEIIKHVDPELLDESVKNEGGIRIEDGHSMEEYMSKFGELYNNGELWDFSEEDFGDAIDVDPNIIYWKIKDKDGEVRYFETPLEDEDEGVHECKEVALKEGTSNFPTRFPHGFPLLVFYTVDEVYDRMSYDSDYPEESKFEDEDGNVDYDAYEEARDAFEQKYWDELDCCVLDESQIEELEDKLYDFNQETKSIAYDADVNEDGYQEYGDKLNLEDVELKIEPGYYEAAYIDVDHENYLDYIEDGEWKDAQIKRIKDFMESLAKEFGLSEYEVAWGPASNGETGYKKVKREESVEEELGKETIYIKYWEDEELRDQGISEVYLDKFESIEDAKEVARKLIDRDGYASVEVFISPKGEIESEDDKLVWGYDGVDTWEESLDEKKSKKKYKAHFVGDPDKEVAFFNHAMGSDVSGSSSEATSSEGPISEGKEEKVEFCLMSDGDNIDCYTSEDEAIKSAKEYFEEIKNRNLKKNVRVLKVTYGPENEAGDSEEKDLENVWDSGDIDGHYFESLEESMKSEVTKWWKDVEDANKEMKWEFNIDNGDFSDVEAMHAAMFDMLDNLKEKGASELFDSGKKIYNKYAKYSKYTEELKEEKEGYFTYYCVSDGYNPRKSIIIPDGEGARERAIEMGKSSDSFKYVSKFENGDEVVIWHADDFDPKGMKVEALEKCKVKVSALDDEGYIKHSEVIEIEGPYDSGKILHKFFEICPECKDSPLSIDWVEEECIKEEVLDEMAKLPYHVLAWKLAEVISSMNNEDAYFGDWLYLWPDGESKEDCKVDFNDKESYDELKELFEEVYKYYHKDGLYTDDQDILDYAHAIDKKLGLEPIKNFGKIKEVNGEEDPYSDLEEEAHEEEIDICAEIEKVLEDYGILYGDIVDWDNGKINIVGIDPEEWEEAADAITTELGFEVLLPSGEGYDDELVVLHEASSAEKKAFKQGGKAYGDYIDGKAIARIKDPDERARAIANKKLANKDKLGDRPSVDKEQERKVNQAEVAFQKKQQKMADAGLEGE